MILVLYDQIVSELVGEIRVDVIWNSDRNPTKLSRNYMRTSRPPLMPIELYLIQQSFKSEGELQTPKC